MYRAWNKYFASAGHCVRQSALRACHSQFVSVFCIWCTIEIWKPTGHCDRQKTNPVGHTWNRAGRWPMTGGYFMHCIHMVISWIYMQPFVGTYAWKSWFFTDLWHFVGWLKGSMLSHSQLCDCLVWQCKHIVCRYSLLVVLLLQFGIVILLGLARIKMWSQLRCLTCFGFSSLVT